MLFMYDIGELLLNWRRYYSLYVSQNFLRAHAIFPSRHILCAFILLYPLVYFHTILLSTPRTSCSFVTSSRCWNDLARWGLVCSYLAILGQTWNSFSLGKLRSIHWIAINGFFADGSRGQQLGILLMLYMRRCEDNSVCLSFMLCNYLPLYVWR